MVRYSITTMNAEESEKVMAVLDKREVYYINRMPAIEGHETIFFECRKKEWKKIKKKLRLRYESIVARLRK